MKKNLIQGKSELRGIKPIWLEQDTWEITLRQGECAITISWDEARDLAHLIHERAHSKSFMPGLLAASQDASSHD